MREDHTTLHSMAVLELVAPDEPSVPIEVELRYDTRDPWAVTMAFHAGPSRWVEWCFARDLLADGLIAETGSGDVRIRPDAEDAESVELVISSPSGRARFEAPARELACFLDRTHDMVPPGAEGRWVSVDDALATLFLQNLN
ncbi:SsgA family sporulation/cell division regulator [Kutzneria sp. NPDC052558]|uniref:SsgA family sporulation/cell division regulator n=1 Tax=Kutzneria sp. NPDC052558 TaxID=3364121 RepID=UPI0037C5148B